jgi:hypothetical protein
MVIRFNKVVHFTLPGAFAFRACGNHLFWIIALCFYFLAQPMNGFSRIMRLLKDPTFMNAIQRIVRLLKDPTFTNAQEACKDSNPGNMPALSLLTVCLTILPEP